jgi:FAD/FMN-containing dehydrogenase
MSGLDAITIDGESVRLPADAVRSLAARLQGETVLPGSPGYEEARHVWNGMIDRHPALVARCASTADVVEAVGFARAHRLLVAVRGGGHSVAGHATCDGGIVIDLSPLREASVDRASAAVRVGGGARLADMDAATKAHGLAVPAGVVSDTGIAGLTLGGGLGWLRNRYGLTCDNLLSAEVVTARGEVLTASETEHPDLFWGLRGGGGNLGIVTAFTFRAHPVGPEVWFTAAFHDGRQMQEILRFYREYTADAPDDVSTLAACGRFPPGAEAYPEEVHGLPFVLLIGMAAGPPEEGERLMRPLREFRRPLVDVSGPRPYVQAQQFFDEDYPAGLRYYWKSLNLRELGDEVLDRIVAHALRQPSPLSTVDIWPIGGAVRRRDPSDGAFVGRHVPWMVNCEANWESPGDDAANIAWARDTLADLREYSDGSRYLSFPGLFEEGQGTMRTTFGQRYRRLAALKATYDPANLFRLNQNVPPAGRSERSVTDTP